MSAVLRVTLLTTDLHCGGAERQAVHLARHGAAAGLRPTMLLFADEGGWRIDVPPSVPLRALLPRRPRRRLPSLAWIAALVPQLRRELAARQPDVLVTFLWLPTLITALALRRLVPRPCLVWSVQSDLDQTFAARRTGRLLHLVVRRLAVPVVDRFVAVSSGLGKRLYCRLGVPADRVRVIPNAIDLDRIDVLAREGCSTRGADDTAVQLISVGRLAHAKGMDILLDALGRLRDSESNWRCIVLGEGPERPRLEGRVCALRLEDRVRLLGATANPYRWLSESDVFVSSSRWETFGIAVAEALALGLPVVATATDGARDLIGADQLGPLVPVGDARAIASAVAELVRSPERRRALAAGARMQVRDLDAPLIARRYAAALAESTGRC